jgi:hypothetical protein
MRFLRFTVLFLDFNKAQAEFDPPAITDDITGFMDFSRFGLQNIVKTTANSEEIGKQVFIHHFCKSKSRIGGSVFAGAG